jgi:hypothetical protein
MKRLYLVLTVVFLLACGVSNEQLTATAVVANAQTQTAAPTRTPTAKPTSTPRPTSTPKPTETPLPEPAAIGETVQYGDLEITLLEVVTHTQIMLSSGYGYDAKTGYIFVDLAALVRNRSDKPVKVKMEHIYVVDENKDAWYPFYGGTQTVELERRFNPMATIKLNQIFGDTVVSFEKDTYLRLVWPVHENHDLLFGIKDSPWFAISMK